MKKQEQTKDYEENQDSTIGKLTGIDYSKTEGITVTTDSTTSEFKKKILKFIGF
ncbi:hypothetical protein LJC08_05060 [Methanimicrococcus sp. OttesenSCG-928-J09]|nr:hypothetical protein [Methanimicrococcus sp. OttesenSCG-928-J09]